MTSVAPLLMFTGRAEEALRFYASLFPGSTMELERYGPEEPEREGTVKHATLRIGERAIEAIDSPPVHAFDFTPSISLAAACDDEAEVDRLFAGLSEGGGVLMPLGAYPFAARFAWVVDRFGVSWQLRAG
jgi:predicted 3-demethylubiquinone-9 3-methyltransferase (glyoxalase superfamily)